jgi:predicted DNA binding protein
MKKQTFFTATERDRENLVSFVSRVPLDKRLEWSVEEAKSSRSAQQNRLYHKWAAIIAQETGNSPEAIKEYFKHEFLTPEIVEFGGRVREVYSTTTLKVDEMTEYLKQIDAFAGQQGIFLPHPEDMNLDERQTA